MGSSWPLLGSPQSKGPQACRRSPRPISFFTVSRCRDSLPRDLLLAIGAVHLQQYIVRYYRVIPAIGPLFLLNFIAATVLGLYFLVPARARVSRVRLFADTTLALSGMGVAAGGLLALIISEHAPLFGFMEHGYRFAIVFTIASEVVAILALGIFLALCPYLLLASATAAGLTQPTRRPARR